MGYDLVSRKEEIMKMGKDQKPVNVRNWIWGREVNSVYGQSCDVGMLVFYKSIKIMNIYLFIKIFVVKMCYDYVIKYIFSM